jgi:hypothetical protein
MASLALLMRVLGRALLQQAIQIPSAQQDNRDPHRRRRLKIPDQVYFPILGICEDPYRHRNQQAKMRALGPPPPRRAGRQNEARQAKQTCPIREIGKVLMAMGLRQNIRSDMTM